jgi:hypothetical protein
MTSPTTAQLENGARAVAFRAWQLAGVAMMLHAGEVLRGADQRSLYTIQNALVESALVNARGLAWFLTAHGNDVSLEMYGLPRDDEVGKLRGVIVSTISQHVSHVTTGRPEGEPLPGAWPICELADVLVGRLAQSVRELEASDPIKATWFDPSPIETQHELLAETSGFATTISDNPAVGRLTTALQRYLSSRI